MSQALRTQMPVGKRQPHRYLLLDVFTDTPFAGNPLAVFPDAADLDGDAMKRIAKELNLSETVFITDRRQIDNVSIRIFTPGGEIPFAGHPTVGTACLLRALGWHDGERPLLLREGVGDVPIRFMGNRARLTTAMPLKITESPLTIEMAAESLGLPTSAIASRPVAASCGIRFNLIEIADLDSLRQAQVNGARLQAVFPNPADRDLYLYVRQSARQLRTRMFAPSMGIPEDPATGSAAAPLIGYLSRQESFDRTLDWHVIQGVEMDRPSHIYGQVEHGTHGDIIHIEGESVIIGEGTLYL